MKSRNKKITVVITAYNAERYISRCIDSVINQNDEECEIIVINDASTDNTVDVIKKYGNLVKYIELEENKGPAVGRTKGLFAAKTEFVAFLDSDDYWKEDFARVMKEFLLAKPDLVAANCGYHSIGYNGELKNRPILDTIDENYYKGGNTCPNFFKFWQKYDCIRTGTVLMRTESAKKTNGLREDLRLTEDLEFWGYLATFGKWGFVPEALFVTDQQVLKPAERLEKFKSRFLFYKHLSVQSWMKRINPKLSVPQSIEAFNKYLKNIYTTIAFAKAYTFSFKEAYLFTRDNKNFINQEGWGKGLRIGLKTGPLGWPFICVGLRVREVMKAYIFYIKEKI